MLICGLLLASCSAGTAAEGSGRYAGVLPADLTQWSDAELCRAMKVAPTREVMAESARRELGDCAPEHRRCLVNGYAAGSDAYRACRQYLAQLEALDAGTPPPASVAGLPLLPSTGPLGSGRTIAYSFPDGARLSCTTLRNLISCF